MQGGHVIFIWQNHRLIWIQRANAMFKSRRKYIKKITWILLETTLFWWLLNICFSAQSNLSNLWFGCLSNKMAIWYVFWFYDNFEWSNLHFPLIVCPHSLRDISGQRSPSQKAAFCLVFPQVLSIPATSRRDDNAIVFLRFNGAAFKNPSSAKVSISPNHIRVGVLACVCPKSMQNIKEHWEWLTKYTPFNTQGTPSHSEMPKRVPRAPSKADLET